VRNELELMNLQAEVLFVHDTRGRITNINEFNGHRAPRLFWGKTKRGSVLRFRGDVPETIVTGITQILGDSDDTHIVLAKIIHTLEQQEKIKSIWMGPAYIFDDYNIGNNQAVAVRVTGDNREYLEPGFKHLLNELVYREPCYMVIEDNKAVSVCFSARNTIKAAEAGIETLEEYRGKGYAIAVASAWSAAVHESGKVALYSTSWDNYASQAVARRLQLNLYGTDVSIY
jgi:hypothetical protein